MMKQKKIIVPILTLAVMLLMVGGVYGLRLLYKYEYYLTSREKQENPNWGDFIQKMDLLYG